MVRFLTKHRAFVRLDRVGMLHALIMNLRIVSARV